MAEMSTHVRLALAAIGAYVKDGKIMDVPADAPPELTGVRAGAFVSLKKEGVLRGCIGTIEPTRDSLAEEIIANAICAATQDPRFLPVQLSEVDELTCSVDVLMPSEEVSDASELDPKRYGVIVESGGRRGLLLPDLEGVDTVEEQVDIARHKAFISASAQIKLYRFEVLRYH